MESSIESQIGKIAAKFKYPDSRVLYQITSTLSEIIEEANFEIKKEFIKIVATDPGKIAYIEINMPYETFLEYDVTKDINMGVNVQSLNNIVSRGKKGDNVLFLVSEQNILIKIEGDVIKKYLIPNIEVSIDVPKEIKIDFDTRVVVIGDTFKKILSDASSFGDIVELVADENSFKVRAKTEGPRAEVNLTKGSTSLIELETKGKSVSSYDVNYLKNVLNLAKIAETVEIRFSSEKPIELIFNAPDKSKIRYLLAPTTQ
ncbi:MAG: hypothetical protein RXQ71_04850 [Caldisphaera sp.]|jgi:DNA polymerase sliding clamp subunit (PCNA homolog)|uniref:hypothetical protein n=1 Tax=Caldisphaera sp. TaxID=2060322 RepID=UPI003977E542